MNTYNQFTSESLSHKVLANTILRWMGFMHLLALVSLLLTHPLLAQSPTMAVTKQYGTNCAGDPNAFKVDNVPQSCLSQCSTPGNNCFQWYVYGGGRIVGSSTGMGVQVIWDNPTSQAYVSVSVCGASSISSPFETIYSKPQPAITVSNSITCPGQPVTLTATGAANYTWAGDAEAAGKTGSSIIVHPGKTTIYSVSVTAVNGCSGSASVTVNVPVPIGSGGSITGAPSIPMGAGSNYGTLTLTGYSGTIGQWEVSEDNGVSWTQVGNTGHASLVYQNLTKTTLFQVPVTGTDGCSVYSTIATVPVEQNMNWIQIRAFNKTLVTTASTPGQGTGPQTLDARTQYSADPLTLPTPLNVSATTPITTYISAQKITVPAGVSITSGGTLTLEVKSINSYQTQLRDEYMVSEARSYFDESGLPLQTQSRAISTKTPEQDYTQAQVLAMQPLYGRYHTAVGQTLPAPIGTGGFRYVAGFATAGGVPYNYSHFDSQEGGADRVNNPLPVDAASPLGKYYSNQNDLEPYVPASAYPYSRSESYQDGSGELKRAAGVGEELRMGTGHESYSGAFPVGNELEHYLSLRKLILPSQSNPSSLALKAVKQVGIDVNGHEIVQFADKNGHMIASCLTGKDFTQHMISASTTVAAPVYWNNFSILTGDLNIDISGNSRIQVYQIRRTDDLAVPLTLIYDGPAPYRFTPPYHFNNPQFQVYYQVRSDGDFTANVYKSDGDVLLQQISANTPQSNFSTSRFHVPAAATPVAVNVENHLPSGISYSLTNLKTEQVVSNFSNTLAGGFYSVQLNNNNGTSFATDLAGIPFDENGYNYYLKLTYSYPTANWSYNFYNDAGQLVASLSPKGVEATWQNTPSSVNDLSFLSRYEYNLQGRLIAKTETDAGRTEFVYRKDGQLRFSQNSLQRSANPVRFSYSNYDTYGRVIESGEFEPSTNSAIAFNTLTMPVSLIEGSDFNLSDGIRKDWTRSYYTEAPWPLPEEWNSYIQDYTFGKLAASENPNTRTWYSYDEQGRLQWMLQDINGLGAKMVEYTYDLAGNALEVAYQKGKPDSFYHYYAYDDDLRLKTVYTSRDGNQRDLQATYYYYLHGPLKRIELADKLQGIDYVYTIQGWLKSINHPDKVNDPGKDGVANTANATFAPDAFGLQLDYFSGDYIRANSHIDNFTQVNDPVTSISSGIAPSYNGQILTQTWFTQKSSADILLKGVQINSPQSATYSYDERYQLSQASFAQPDFMNHSLLLQTKYKEYDLQYDLNGNILKLKRNDSNGAIKDDFSYNYIPNTNKVDNITGYKSYEYNSLGELKAEKGGTRNNYIEYDSKGLIQSIYSDQNQTQLKASYSYTDGGSRFKKVDYTTGGITYSVYGRNGLMATYAVENGSPVLQELPIYGIGTYLEDSHQSVYELKNHLGSILSVIRREKSNGQADILSYSDYTALGLKTDKGGDNDYNYGYQGESSTQDEQTDWNSFELRMYDSRVGRWLSVDPYNQYWSPYLSMGNNWINSVDPNGGESDWHKGKNGELIADPGDNEVTLLTYLQGKEGQEFFPGFGTLPDGSQMSHDQLYDLTFKIFSNVQNWATTDGGGVPGGAFIDGCSLAFYRAFFQTDQGVQGAQMSQGAGPDWSEKWGTNDHWLARMTYGMANDPYILYQTLFNRVDRDITYLLTGQMGDPTVRHLGTRMPVTVDEKENALAGTALDLIPEGHGLEAIIHGGISGGKRIAGQAAEWALKKIDSSPVLKKTVNATTQAVENNKVVQEVVTAAKKGGAQVSKKAKNIQNAFKELTLSGLRAAASKLDDATLDRLANFLLKVGDGKKDVILHFDDVTKKYYMEVEDAAGKLHQIELSTSNVEEIIQGAALENPAEALRILSCSDLQSVVEMSKAVPGKKFIATDGTVLLHSKGGVTTIAREGSATGDDWFEIQNGKIIKKVDPPAGPLTEAEKNDYVVLGRPNKAAQAAGNQTLTDIEKDLLNASPARPQSMVWSADDVKKFDSHMGGVGNDNPVDFLSDFQNGYLDVDGAKILLEYPKLSRKKNIQENATSIFRQLPQGVSVDDVRKSVANYKEGVEQYVDKLADLLNAGDVQGFKEMLEGVVKYDAKAVTQVIPANQLPNFPPGQTEIPDFTTNPDILSMANTREALRESAKAIDKKLTQNLELYKQQVKAVGDASEQIAEDIADLLFERGNVVNQTDLLSLPNTSSQVGQFDRVYQDGDTWYVVECKGGESGLQGRISGGKNNQQGTMEYIQSIIDNLNQKLTPEGQAKLDMLQQALNATPPKVKSYVVKQKFADDGTLKDTVIEQVTGSVKETP